MHYTIYTQVLLSSGSAFQSNNKLKAQHHVTWDQTVYHVNPVIQPSHSWAVLLCSPSTEYISMCVLHTNLPSPATQCTATQLPGSSLNFVCSRLSQSSTTCSGGAEPSSKGQSWKEDDGVYVYGNNPIYTTQTVFDL